MGNESKDLPSLQCRVRVPGHVLMRRVGDEMVMLNLERENYYGLDTVGACVMQCAEAGATLEQISERVLEDFEAEREQVQGDVRRIAAELMAAGLLEQDRDR